MIRWQVGANPDGEIYRVEALANELLRKNPGPDDLSDGAMATLKLFDPIDVVELASAIHDHFCESLSDPD